MGQMARQAGVFLEPFTDLESANDDFSDDGMSEEDEIIDEESWDDDMEDFEGRRKEDEGPVTSSRTVFVGNIPFKAKPEELEELLTKLNVGKIHEIRFIYKRDYEMDHKIFQGPPTSKPTTSLLPTSLLPWLSLSVAV